MEEVVGESETDDSDSFGTAKIEVLRVGGKPSLMKVDMNGHEVCWQPDTGTQKDIWDENQFRSFEEQCGISILLKPSNIKLYAYGSRQPLLVVGTFEATLSAGQRRHETVRHSGIVNVPTVVRIISESLRAHTVQ